MVLTGSRVDYTKVQDSGEDLRFIDTDDVTVIDHDIETWNEAGKSYIWVKVPRIDASSSTDFIYPYFDHGSALDGQDSAGVWDNGYVGVWHLDRFPTGGTPIDDSTINAKHGVASVGMDATNLVTGRVGNGLDFDGVTEHLRIASTATDALAITGDLLTLEFWIKRNGDTLEDPWMIPFGRQYGTGSADSYATLLNRLDPSRSGFVTTSGGAVQSGAGAIPDSMWRYVAGVQDATNLTLFTDGAQAAQIASGGSILTDNNDVTVAGMENGADATVTEFFVGTVDEIRISYVARSSRWLAAQHLSTTDMFVTYGIEDTLALPLSIVKRAFLTDGTPIANGVEVPQGVIVKFMLYTNNDTGATISDVSMQDVLDPTFVHQASGIRIDNSVGSCATDICTALEEAAIFASVDGQASASDAVDGDTVCYNAGTFTIDAGDQSVGNAQLDAAANKVLAVLFTTKIQ